MEFKKLSEGFGAEVHGVDLRDEKIFEKLKRAFYQYQVLVVRGQKLTATEFLQ